MYKTLNRKKLGIGLYFSFKIEYLCPIMYRCIKNRKQDKCQMRGKENVYSHSIDGNISLYWDMKIPNFQNLFSKRLWIPVNN